MQQYAGSLLRITDPSSTRAPSGVARSLELLDRKFRATAYGLEYADVVVFMQIRRTEADFGAYVARSNLVEERAFQHSSGELDEPMSKQLASAHLLHTASLSLFLARREEIWRIWQGKNPRLDASLSGRPLIRDKHLMLTKRTNPTFATPI